MKSERRNLHTIDVDPIKRTGSSDLAKLASLIRAHAPYDGVFDMPIPGVRIARASRASKELYHTVQEAALCMVVQGAKRVMLGQEAYEYDASRMMIYSIDLPVTAQVTRASQAEPYLALRLNLDHLRIADLVLKVFSRGLPRVQGNRAVCVTQADTNIVNALVRLFELMAEPESAKLLAPLVIDEILIRLLCSSVGVKVAQIGLSDSGVSGVAKAVSWLRANFSQSVKIEELAALAHMSVSVFHQHFKSATSMSPLQYQKALRLQAARRLMLSTTLDAGSAGLQVGYVSASQFSREYGRFFGSAPTRDIARLREQGLRIADISH